MGLDVVVAVAIVAGKAVAGCLEDASADDDGGDGDGRDDDDDDGPPRVPVQGWSPPSPFIPWGLLTGSCIRKAGGDTVLSRSPAPPEGIPDAVRSGEGTSSSAGLPDGIPSPFPACKSKISECRAAMAFSNCDLRCTSVDLYADRSSSHFARRAL